MPGSVYYMTEEHIERDGRGRRHCQRENTAAAEALASPAGAGRRPGGAVRRVQRQRRDGRHHGSPDRDAVEHAAAVTDSDGQPVREALGNPHAHPDAVDQSVREAVGDAYAYADSNARTNPNSNTDPHADADANADADAYTNAVTDAIRIGCALDLRGELVRQHRRLRGKCERHRSRSSARDDRREQ
jgi:hypothetical protein